MLKTLSRAVRCVFGGEGVTEWEGEFPDDRGVGDEFTGSKKTD